MKILISGISGKMGKLLKQDVIEHEQTTFVGGFDLVDAYEEQDDFDVLIDFSHASQIRKVVDFCIKHHKPLVTATTGLTEEDHAYIKAQSNKIAIFQSHNFSYGIQVLLKALNAVLPIIDDYDIEITEKHHQYKVDAPSGTAKMIVDDIKKVRTHAKVVNHYEGKRNKQDIGVHALRAGTIVGEHEILLASKDEMITIKHEALSKQIFSQGAIKAALFIKNKKSGLYQMKDLI